MIKNDILRFIGIVVLVFVGYHMGTRTGYNKGFLAGQKDSSDNFNSIRDLDKMWCDKQTRISYSEGVTVGIRMAKEDGEKECEDRISIIHSMEKEALKEAFKLGQISGMKRTAKLCGIKTK